MMVRLSLAALIASLLSAPAWAEDYGAYPAPSWTAPYPQSFLSDRTVIVPRYGRLPVRIYTTPPQGPFYNVPPQPVIAPF